MQALEDATSRYGAKRQTWEEVDPRELLAKYVRDYGDDKSALAEAMWPDVKRNNKFLYSIFMYWLTNNLRSLFDPRYAAAAEPRRGAARVEREQQIEAIVERARAKFHAKFLSLDFMIGDRPLRDYTFGELATLRVALGNLTGPRDKKVGDVLTEEQFQAAVRG